jgi:hypothetical protein
MAFETVTKNLTDLGLDPQLVQQIIANEKVAAGLQGYVESGLRQSDYDRKMNSGKAEIAAAKQELDEFKAKLESDRVRMNGQFLTAQQEREAAESRLAAVQAKAKTLGQVYGIDAEKELFGDAIVQPPARQTQQPDVSNDFTRRLEQVESLVPGQVNLTTELMDIARQHAELFPSQSLNFQDLMKDSIAQRRSPTSVWDDKFGATAKRQEITADKFRAEGRAQAEAEYKQKLSEQKVNPFGIATPPSAIFQAAANKGGNKAPLSTKQQSTASAIQRATEALLSHKYAPGNAGANH